MTEGGGEGDEMVISLSFQDMNWWKVVWRKLSVKALLHGLWHLRTQIGGSLEPDGEYTSSA